MPITLDRRFAIRGVSTITRRIANPRTHPTTDSLRAALPPALTRALDAALAAAPGVEVWAVGGAVRDVALARQLLDLDLATSGDPEPLAAAAARALEGVVEAHPRFGTASASGAGGRLDFARLRTERYASPGALPAPEFGTTIEADLARRDFSVNAIALCLAGPRAGEVFDPQGGLDDLALGRLRVLHADSFRDDATRIWRGARYAARLGLRADSHTRAAIEAGVRWLASVSGERLWSEVERTAAEPSPLRVLALLEDWGALAASAPGLRLHPDSRRALARRRGPIAVGVLMAALLAPLEARAVICVRFGAPREVLAAADGARALLDCDEATPDALAALEGTSEAARTAAAWLAPASQRTLQQALRRWERTRSPLTAQDLERAGVAAGPALGEWLRVLRRERFLGNLHTKAAARRLVHAQPGESA